MRLIDSKLVFKKKIYGQFRAHLVPQGYTQISRLEFTDKYPQVVTDITLHIILLMWLINKGYYQKIYVQKQFLYAVL